VALQFSLAISELTPDGSPGRQDDGGWWGAEAVLVAAVAVILGHRPRVVVGLHGGGFGTAGVVR
jgi:hypothetical protein